MNKSSAPESHVDAFSGFQVTTSNLVKRKALLKRSDRYPPQEK